MLFLDSQTQSHFLSHQLQHHAVFHQGSDPTRTLLKTESKVKLLGVPVRSPLTTPASQLEGFYPSSSLATVSMLVFSFLLGIHNTKCISMGLVTKFKNNKQNKKWMAKRATGKHWGDNVFMMLKESVPGFWAANALTDFALNNCVTFPWASATFSPASWEPEIKRKGRLSVVFISWGSERFHRHRQISDYEPKALFSFHIGHLQTNDEALLPKLKVFPLEHTA